MISVQEALDAIKQQVEPLDLEAELPIDIALNRVTAKTINAPFSLPSFRQSIMDGYAVNIHSGLNYKLVGEVKTGDGTMPNLLPGEAVRIFTGALVPDMANAVVMQERVVVEKQSISLENHPRPQQFIRQIGEQLESGEEAIPKGFTINAAAIALLKSLGIQQLDLYRKPRVSILVTGNELSENHESLSTGKIYESNSSMIQAALQSRNIDLVEIVKIPDSLTATEEAFLKLKAKSDLILVSGGISVGDYDFVREAVLNMDADIHFYKVKQKPGKPLLFATWDQTHLLCLPGNPASTLTCLYIYGFELIDRLCGAAKIGLQQLEIPLAETIQNETGRALFLKASIEGNQVKPLRLQQSSAILSLAMANALIYIPEEVKSAPKGSLCHCFMLP